eukprot:CAMPEP_0176265278 /NCGR_PEP_ID=MMETSP0121_2-20121125/42062_1 /TAXON_ID=160619 /ORGANISM="Kryptoperidinium foliaceum, Strain CCMP 1326" /LENGTH=314 /DNA_ID=CAMNT_0017605307 /DNA_START=247 /DNA_END=1189 /DNA_ORIENTATION=-
MRATKGATHVSNYARPGNSADGPSADDEVNESKVRPKIPRAAGARASWVLRCSRLHHLRARPFHERVPPYNPVHDLKGFCSRAKERRARPEVDLGGALAAVHPAVCGPLRSKQPVERLLRQFPARPSDRGLIRCDPTAVQPVEDATRVDLREHQHPLHIPREVEVGTLRLHPSVVAHMNAGANRHTPGILKERQKRGSARATPQARDDIHRLGDRYHVRVSQRSGVTGEGVEVALQERDPPLRDGGPRNLHEVLQQCATTIPDALGADVVASSALPAPSPAGCGLRVGMDADGGELSLLWEVAPRCGTEDGLPR